LLKAKQVLYSVATAQQGHTHLIQRQLVQWPSWYRSIPRHYLPSCLSYPEESSFSGPGKENQSTLAKAARRKWAAEPGAHRPAPSALGQRLFVGSVRSLLTAHETLGALLPMKRAECQAILLSFRSTVLVPLDMGGFNTHQHVSYSTGVSTYGSLRPQPK